MHTALWPRKVLMLFTLVSVIVLATPATPAHAATSTWDGGGASDLWSDALNWDADVVPSPGNEIIIPSGSSDVHVDTDVTVDGDLELSNSPNALIVDAGSTLTINGDVSFVALGTMGTLTNHGTIDGTGRFIGDLDNTAGGTIEDIRIELKTHAENHGILNGVQLDFGNAGGYVYRNFGSIIDSDVRVKDVYFAVHPELINEPAGTITGGILGAGGAPSGIYRNFGTVTNHGTITGSAIVDVYDTLDNLSTGSIDNTGGTFTLRCETSRGWYGQFSNDGSFIGDPLEGDCLAWDGGGGTTSWSDPANWNIDRVPLSSDRFIVIPGDPSADITVHLDADHTSSATFPSVSIRGVSATDTTLIVDATRTLTLVGSLSRLDIREGTLINRGTVLAEGRVFLGFVSIFDPGVLENEGTLTLEADTFIRDTSALHNTGTITNDGAITNDGTITNACGATIGGIGTIEGNEVIDEEPCDGDGDGFSTAEGDCDDGDPGIHPGATEVLNGVDDDCDGVVDGFLDIDIIPGSDVNPVNLRSKGVIPVAVLGSGAIEVGDIEIASLSFGSGGALMAHGGHIEDVNDDGIDDLVAHFRTADTGLESGDSSGCLTWSTGVSNFEACDVVKTVGK